MKQVFVSENGNTSFSDFLKYYQPHLETLVNEEDTYFILADFRGIDVLSMEFLKTRTSNVKIYHIGEKPRYFPDKFKTLVKNWTLLAGFTSDNERDNAAIKDCTHFLAIDFNSDEFRKSGTQKNIDNCILLGKISIL